MAESSSVFVGNIPYDVTEEQLLNLFRQFGEIQRFRLQLDSGGKGKGYGFCDFVTVEAAENAKRMNNFISINGRQLRVDSASQPSAANIVQSQQSTNAAAMVAAASAVAAAAAAAQASKSTTSSSTASYHTTTKSAKELDDALRQLTYGEVYTILEEVRVWIKRDPDGARELLKERPSLANALLKMNMQMAGLVNSPPADMQFGMVPPAPPPPVANRGDDLLQSILQMTEAEVAALVHEEQVKVRNIRQMYRHAMPQQPRG